VKDNAVGKISSRRDGLISGNLGAGRPCGMRPKWLPIVSIGKWSSSAAIESGSDCDQHPRPRWPPVPQNKDHCR